MKTPPTPTETRAFRRALGAAAEIYGTAALTLIRERSTKRSCVVPRQFVYTVLRREGLSLAVIGHLFDRDHSTVLAGIRAFKDERALELWDGSAQREGMRAIERVREVRDLRDRVAELEAKLAFITKLARKG